MLAHRIRYHCNYAMVKYKVQGTRYKVRVCVRVHGKTASIPVMRIPCWGGGGGQRRRKGGDVVSATNSIHFLTNTVLEITDGPLLCV